MHWAIRNYKPGYIYHGTDICVPISKLPEAIEYCQKLFQILGVEGKFMLLGCCKNSSQKSQIVSS